MTWNRRGRGGSVRKRVKEKCDKCVTEQAEGEEREEACEGKVWWEQKRQRGRSVRKRVWKRSVISVLQKRQRRRSVWKCVKDKCDKCVTEEAEEVEG
jgi:hypothetical protein